MSTPTQLPWAGSNAGEDKQLRAKFDTLATRVADLEKVYRDLGLKFFVLPPTHRRSYFGTDYEEAKQMFLLTTDGETPQVAQLLNSLRFILESLKKHIHRLGLEQIHGLEASYVKDATNEAGVFYHQAKVMIRPWVDKMGGVYPNGSRGEAVIPMFFAARMHGSGLPQGGWNREYDDFRAWALTVREVQNLVTLGSTEEEAIASLSVGVMAKEDRPAPSLGERILDLEYDTDGEVSDDDYFSEDNDDDSSAVSNRWWEPDENVPLAVLQAGLQRPDQPPGAIQLR